MRRPTQPATPKARRKRRHISTRPTTPIVFFFVMMTSTTVLTMLLLVVVSLGPSSAVQAFVLSPSYAMFRARSQHHYDHAQPLLFLSSFPNEHEQPTTTSSSSHTKQHPHYWKVPPHAHILNTDPLMYTIPNLLSQDECQAYLDHVDQLVSSSSSSSSQPTRTMTRSNPPQVSLDLRQLWPLPFLSIAAGLPNLIKLLDYHSDASAITPTDILRAVQVPIGIAWVLSLILVILAEPVVQWISNRSARTSEALALNHIDDFPQITNLVQRVEHATGHAWKYWEAPVVTRYNVGAVFAKHGDASPQKGAEWSTQGGQRVITCICYLHTLADEDDNDNDGGSGDSGAGGETYFERLGIAVQPKAGTALVFFPADYDTLVADDRTIHESLPPTTSEKWIVQLFGRIDRVPPPLGIPDEFQDYLLLQNHNTTMDAI